jgi:hypothetical protein
MDKSLVEQAIKILDSISSNTSDNPREDAHQAIILLNQYLNAPSPTVVSSQPK